MGGGDLNFKKSWHPQTFQNVEKVWIAEQKKVAEDKKIQELLKEKEEERQMENLQLQAINAGHIKKKSDRLDWMYQGARSAAVVTKSREEYLLGKTVEMDKIKEEPPKSTNAPGSLFGQASTPLSVLDLESKIREDPLLMIKKREQESLKEILNNPVKMRQLKKLREATEGKKDKKDKKEKKEKKEKK
eukprot:Opistho-2@18407